MNYERLPEWRLWLRSLTPSAASLAGSFAFVVLIMGFHLLLLSGDPSLFLPHLAGRQANDQLAQAYASVVQQPLDRTFGNDSFGVLSTALVWGFIGWLIYAAIDFILIAVREFRSDAKQVSVPDTNKVIEHPLHRQLSVRALWRFTVGLLLVVATVGLRPVVSNLFQNDVKLLMANSVIEMIKLALIILISWMVLLHLYVVLFRLFVLRTRLFGEIIY
jgi:hypothetical protein